ncbi:MAG: alpha/beta hydrolase [Phycisphaeraceae bacterium]|nr:alpha/beta hydrolase [Phycisphaeraceae bacterium]
MQQPDSQASTCAAAEDHLSKWPIIRRIFIFALVLGVGVYVAWWAALYFMQDELLFPGKSLPVPARTLRFPNAKVIVTNLPDGGQAEAWLIPGIGVDDQHPGPMVMYFHGNAELIDYLDDVILAYWQRGISVLLPEYRGYGRVSGEPSQQALREDCLQFFDIAMEQPMVDRNRIVFHGRSLGSAVAVDLASYRKPAGLVIESAFTSMVELAHDLAAPGFLVRNPYLTDQVLPLLHVPTLIMHGADDDIIPVKYGRKLAALTPDAAYVELKAGHNDLAMLPEYWPHIFDLLHKLNIRTEILARKLPASGEIPDSTTQPDTQPAATAPATQP